MVWYIGVADFFGGAFLVNAVPHFVQGTSGRKFPSPFARPPGRGESSPLVNAVWGSINFAVAYLLLVKVVRFDLNSRLQVLLAGLGGFLMALALARNFGDVYRQSGADR